MNEASISAILWPMLAHMSLTFFLYVWITAVRMLAVRRGEVDYSTFVLGREEPLEIARVTRNLSNQFELPVAFYALVAVLIATDRVITFDVLAAWVFVAGRVIHMLVQTLTNNVPLRGQVFMINFLAVVALAMHVAWLAWTGI